MDERKKAFITRGAFRPVMARPLYTMSATRETGAPWRLARTLPVAASERSPARDRSDLGRSSPFFAQTDPMRVSRWPSRVGGWWGLVCRPYSVRDECGPGPRMVGCLFTPRPRVTVYGIASWGRGATSRVTSDRQPPESTSPVSVHRADGIDVRPRDPRARGVNRCGQAEGQPSRGGNH